MSNWLELGVELRSCKVGIKFQSFQSLALSITSPTLYQFKLSYDADN